MRYSINSVVRLRAVDFFRSLKILTNLVDIIHLPSAFGYAKQTQRYCSNVSAGASFEICIFTKGEREIKSTGLAIRAGAS